jgi:undecaprenyl-diphosphatase
VFENINKEIFNYFNYIANKNNFLDEVIFAIGEYSVYVFIIFLIYIYFILKYKDASLFSFYSVCLVLLINYIIGLVYFHDRPFIELENVNLLVLHDSDSSFPSDHTSFMMSIAFCTLFFIKDNKIIYYLVLLAFLSGMCRIIEGIHYPFDILGSICTSYISVKIIMYYQYKFVNINRLIKNIF